MRKLFDMMKGITMIEVLEAEEMLEDLMFEENLSGNIPVNPVSAFLFCLGKRVGINEERRRRKGGRKHD